MFISSVFLNASQYTFFFQKSFKNLLIKHVLYTCYLTGSLQKQKEPFGKKKADSCNVLKGLLLPTDTRASGRAGSLWESTRTRDSSRGIASLGGVTKPARWPPTDGRGRLYRRWRQRIPGNSSAFPDYRQNILYVEEWLSRKRLCSPYYFYTFRALSAFISTK